MALAPRLPSSVRGKALALAFAVAAALGIYALAMMEEPAVQADSGANAAASTIVAPVPAGQGSYVPGELIVGLADALEGSDALKATQEAIGKLGFDASEVLYAVSAGQSFADTMLLVKTDDVHQMGAGLADAEQQIAQLEGIDFVQPNYRLASAEVKAVDVARDEDVAKQYYLDGPANHGANVAAAWSLVDPARKVGVAVLDTGIYSMTEHDADGEVVAVNSDKFHQEFDAENLDMEHGVDFVHSGAGELLPIVNKNNPRGDDNGHGTHVSALIAAKAQTSGTPGELPCGMAGVSPNARIVPLKVLNEGGEGDISNFIKAYEYLLQNKQSLFPDLRIVNMSVSLTLASDADSTQAGGNEPPVETNGTIEIIEEDPDDPFGTPAMRAVIQQAKDQGVITVCAAGNDSSAQMTFPSDYPECVSVTALDPDGKNASYSNINKYKDVSAPGTGIYSAWATQADSYRVQDGTSQATAIVSGVLSMLWAVNPDLGVQQAKYALYTTARPVAQDGSPNIAAQALAGADGAASSTAPNGGALVGAAAQEVVNGSKGAVDAEAAVRSVKEGRLGEWVDEDGGTITGPKEEPKLSLENAQVTVSPNPAPYTGKPVKPAVTVVLDTGGPEGAEELEEGFDFTVAYENNVKPGTGTAKATVTGIDEFRGSQTVAFSIAPATTSIKKLKAGARSFTVTWKRQKAGNVGYQVRYSPNKSMKGAKTKPVGKNRVTKLRVSNLKPKRAYYVQVRTFKKIGKKTYYSAWSKARAVKVK